MVTAADTRASHRLSRRQRPDNIPASPISLLAPYVPQTRCFTALADAPPLNASGLPAFEISPPSIIISRLFAPSTFRKTELGVRTRDAVTRTPRVSTNLSSSACGLPSALSPLTD